MTVHVPPKFISCSPSNIRSPLPLGNPTPTKDQWFGPLGEWYQHLRKRVSGSSLEAVYVGSQHFTNFSTYFYSIWQAYFTVCGLRFWEFPCFIKNGAFSVFLLCFAFCCFRKIWGGMSEKEGSKNVFAIFTWIYLWCACLYSLPQLCTGRHRST